MRFRLKDSTAKKLREQLYLGLFFGFIIWVLMAILFIGDSTQTAVLYLAGSAIIIPYLYQKQIKPFFNELNANTREAFIELDDVRMIYDHFSNKKQFGQQQIEIKFADIVQLKQAFRKDSPVNKITLTVKHPSKDKVVIEDFENMEQMVEMINRSMAAQQTQTPDSPPGAG